LRYFKICDMITAENIEFKYADGPQFKFPTIHCSPENPLLILGESGTGKTTLLHLLAGLLKPTNGSVIIDGSNTSSMSGATLDKFRGKNIGIIFQTAHFVNALSVADNLILPPFLTGEKIDKQKAIATLERLRLGNKASKKPAQLSVGEAQRVAIARAVMNNPRLILADEPTSALDDKNASEVIALLEEQAKNTGAALIIVTHDKRLKDHFKNQVTL
jgi:lipoprotein-releasing system ATP-binding protein